MNNLQQSNSNSLLKNQKAEEPYKEWNQLGAWSRFWIFCSGADPVVLKEFPKDFSLYQKIGRCVFVAAFLSGIAATYALASVVESWVIPYIGGLIWGALVILNLDRYLLASYNKAEYEWGFINSTEENNEQKWIRNIKRYVLPFFQVAVLIRLGLSFLIALTISYPLEILVFRNQIDGRKEGVIEQETQSYRATVEANVKAIDEQIKEATARLDSIDRIQDAGITQTTEGERLSTELKACEKQLSEKIASNNRETSEIRKQIEDTRKAETKFEFNPETGKNISILTRNGRSRINDLQADINKIRDDEKVDKAKCDAIRNSLNLDKESFLAFKETLKKNETNKINELRARKEIEQLAADRRVAERLAEINKSRDGLPRDIEVLGILATEKPMIYGLQIVLTLIFSGVELLPFFLKMSSSPSEYDVEKARIKRASWKIALLKMTHDVEFAINSYVIKEQETLRQATEAVVSIDKAREVAQARKEVEKKYAERIAKYEQETARLVSHLKEKIKQFDESLSLNKELHDKEIQNLQQNTKLAENKANIEIEELNKQMEVELNRLHEENERRILEEQNTLIRNAEKEISNIKARYEAAKKKATVRAEELGAIQAELAEEYVKSYREKTKATNNSILEQAAQAQIYIARKQLDAWKREQEKDIK